MDEEKERMNSSKHQVIHLPHTANSIIRNINVLHYIVTLRNIKNIPVCCAYNSNTKQNVL